MKITDEMLYRHAAEARDIWLSAFPNDSEIPEHEFSEEFNKEMERLVALSQKQKKTNKRLQRIAAIFAVVIIGASSFIGVNAEARAAFVGWVKEVTGNLFVYRYESEGQVSAEPSDYRPAWLPDGYSEFMTIDDNSGSTIIYKDESGKRLKFGYIQAPHTAALFVDTTDTVQSNTTVNGISADFFSSTSEAVSSIVMWIDNDLNMAFYVSGFQDEETLVYIAEHIEPIASTD